MSKNKFHTLPNTADSSVIEVKSKVNNYYPGTHNWSLIEDLQKKTKTQAVSCSGCFLFKIFINFLWEFYKVLFERSIVAMNHPTALFLIAALLHLLCY